eukprot:c20418_g1_i4 orf=282-476(+)
MILRLGEIPSSSIICTGFNNRYLGAYFTDCFPITVLTTPPTSSRVYINQNNLVLSFCHTSGNNE